MKDTGGKPLARGLISGVSLIKELISVDFVFEEFEGCRNGGERAGERGLIPCRALPVYQIFSASAPSFWEIILGSRFTQS